MELSNFITSQANSSFPFLIAGPCAAESEEQVMRTSRQLVSIGCKIFRAGAWKPRTRPNCFEGYGEKALLWLRRVKEETGMLVATEVATPHHVELALNSGIDVLWIGARTSANPFAIQSIADSLRGIDVPVMVKNPINPDIDLWIGAFERLNQVGIRRIAAIHRGFSSYGNTIYRNPPMWQIPIELHRRIPNLPIICDPSHMGGKRELLLTLSQQAIDLGFDGLMIEVHCSPDVALSDAKQQITPSSLAEILGRLIVREKTNFTALEGCRNIIDQLDDEIISLLSKRMDVSKEIAQFKKEHNQAIHQSVRYGDLIEKWKRVGLQYGLDTAFMERLFSIIHEASVSEQLQIVANK